MVELPEWMGHFFWIGGHVWVCGFDLVRGGDDRCGCDLEGLAALFMQGPFRVHLLSIPNEPRLLHPSLLTGRHASV